jgi:ion channel-forming bestrophin family protein
VIVKRRLKLSRILAYTWRELALVGGVALVACVLRIERGEQLVALPFGPLGVLGTALAILLGFRNNTGYARWWEARTIWAQIASSCRSLARQLSAATENAGKLGKGGGAEALAAYKREMLYRLIAFAHALRLELRREDRWDQLAPLLPAEDLMRVRAAVNKPNAILVLLGGRLKDGVREEKLGQFDPISLEPGITALQNAQAGCEKIKDTPMLRQYEYFARWFLWTFLVLLPPSILGLFSTDAGRWLTIPISIAIGFVYAITARTGQVTEDPFENRIHDLPMTAICNAIERDLRDQLGETELPAATEPVEGYLY